MNIVYDIIRKVKYLKPSEFYNERILEYFLKTSLKNYFNDEDNYEIIFNVKNNYLEITNLSSSEEYLIEKKENSLDFIKNNEILFHIKNNIDKISLVENNDIKIIKLNEDNEQYSIINNSDGIIYTLSDLKVKISNKNYFELRNSEGRTKIIGIVTEEKNKYEQIFNYLEQKIINKPKIKKRILFKSISV